MTNADYRKYFEANASFAEYLGIDEIDFQAQTDGRTLEEDLAFVMLRHNELALMLDNEFGGGFVGKQPSEFVYGIYDIELGEFELGQRVVVQLM